MAQTETLSLIHEIESLVSDKLQVVSHSHTLSSRPFCFPFRLTHNFRATYATSVLPFTVFSVTAFLLLPFLKSVLLALRLFPQICILEGFCRIPPFIPNLFNFMANNLIPNRVGSSFRFHTSG